MPEKMQACDPISLHLRRAIRNRLAAIRLPICTKTTAAIIELMCCESTLVYDEKANRLFIVPKKMAGGLWKRDE